ncbi:MAG TPA: acyl-CoA dehydrogenase family protein [Acidimicrobiales bacterium]|jgi:alkylation response protein AidB-like acyl-CoA dehydrogenase|nr:acyl-CoA dehydrogenase family protein [Acidimicrobiales bacterium]
MGTNHLLDAARKLAPELSERALEAEQQRTLPIDLVDRARGAGLFHLAMPAALGGHESDPITIFEVIEELSRADGSAGWTVFIGNSTAFVAWLEPEVAKEIVASRPDFITTGVFAPTGTARPSGDSDGAYVVDGRWTFNSGCPHADWFMNGVVVMDGDAPRMVGDRPDWRFAFYPASDGEIIDTWHVAGLRGTGSHDTTAAGVRVPIERTIAPFFEPAKFDGPLYRVPFASMLTTFLAAFPLGVARRALDEFAALSLTKARIAGPGAVMAEDEAVQVELARAEATVRSARAYVIDALGDAYDTAVAGGEVSMQQRAATLMATMHAARSARTATDSVFAMSGGGALYDSSPLQRCMRDLVAGTQHLFYNINRWKTIARVQLGMDPATFMI